MSIYMETIRLAGTGSRLQRARQAGMITTFTAVLILMLLTLMTFFAVRVGIFDQRVSANDMRQKRAFHAAESGIQHAKQFLEENFVRVASTEPVIAGDEGWLAAGTERWQKCSDVLGGLTDNSHPCLAEPDVARRSDLYFWSYNNSTLLPVNTGGVLPSTDELIEVQALLCVLDVDYELEVPVKGCSTDTSAVDGSRYMVMLIARGNAECDVDGNCGSEATIRDQVANFGIVAGGQAPGVPLTTKSSFPPSGAAEIVANPNGGGVGVPTSVWMNQNPACSGGAAVTPSQGSWATCEAHEWYELESIPDSIACPGSCSCAVQESISNTHGSTDVLGIDLLLDDEFPCDLFKAFFGVPRTDYEVIKSFATVLTDCSTLGPNSSGVYWISGSSCDIQSNITVGSPKAPVLIVSAAGVTSMQGGAVIFGVLYVVDVEAPAAYFESRGNNIVYGQVIVDAEFGSYNGTFQVVYSDVTIGGITGNSGLGNMLGGWADFHSDWR